MAHAKEAAARHFTSARRLASSLESRLETQDDGGETALDTARLVVEALQWQFECYGQDEYMTKCKECLEEQMRWLKKAPGLASDLSGGILRTRLAHSVLFLQMDDPLELAGVEEQLSKMTFLSPMPAGSTSALRQPQPSPSAFKTPMAVQEASEGDSKEKGGRITRRTATAAKAAPRKRLVPKPQKK